MSRLTRGSCEVWRDGRESDQSRGARDERCHADRCRVDRCGVDLILDGESSRRKLVFRGLLIGTVTLMVISTTAAAGAADPATIKRTGRVDEALRKSQGWLLKQTPVPEKGEWSLAAYAVIKAGRSPQDPWIQGILRDVIAKIDRGAYETGPTEHQYEAACDAMLLVEVDPVAHRSRLEKIRDYILKRQLSSGAWDYPNSPDVRERGDTSISQFALLGLWAIRRSEIPVDDAPLAKLGNWLVESQRKDGGFAYHPFETNILDQTRSTLSMTAAGCGAALIVKRLLFGDRPELGPAAAPTWKKRFGVLEGLADETAKSRNASNTAVDGTLSENLDKAVQRAVGWLKDNYRPDNIAFPFFHYQHYACERTGTLLDVDRFGPHRWFEEGAEALIRIQQPSGEWPSDANRTVSSTAFAMLFLSRSTLSIVGPRKPSLTGGGLLAGGRGLPSVNAPNLKPKGPDNPLDQLLAELDQATAAAPVAVPAVVEAIQIGDRQALVGQIPRLQELLRHPQVEVRQVATWALGRSGDLRQAPRLISMLDDPSLDVAAEASFALCTLSRQPRGLQLTANATPLAPDPPDAGGITDEQWSAAVNQWRKTLKTAWQSWYLQVRPYDERDDRQQIRAKATATSPP